MRPLKGNDRMKTLLLLCFAQSLIGQQFEAAVVKLYDHKNDRMGPWGPYTMFGCYVGPSPSVFRCEGSVVRLVAESPNLQPCQYKEPKGPEYVVVAKVPERSTRPALDLMLGSLLKSTVGVRYHFEKRSMKGLFLTVTDASSLKKLVPVDAPIAPERPVRDILYTNRWFAFVPDRHFNHDDEIIDLKNVDANLLVHFIFTYLRLPIMDATGIKHRFNMNFVLQWDTSRQGEREYLLPQINKVLAQYGLALQARTGPVNFLIVDSVASENKFLN
jgi:uncharacterized protein (TIGR03435 family)